MFWSVVVVYTCSCNLLQLGCKDPSSNLSVTFLSDPLDVLQAVVPPAEALQQIRSHLAIDVNEI